MERRVKIWLEIGAIASLGLASVILAVITLDGMPTSIGGLLFSPTMASGMNLAVLVGAAIILGLELAHLRSRRISRARLAAASAAPSLGPA